MQGIFDYIATDSPSAAHRVVVGIDTKIQLLKGSPRLGQRYEAIVDREVREILYGHYRIAYLLQSETRIQILGIYHGAMDIDRYLQ